MAIMGYKALRPTPCHVLVYLIIVRAEPRKNARMADCEWCWRPGNFAYLAQGDEVVRAHRDPDSNHHAPHLHWVGFLREASAEPTAGQGTGNHH